MFTGLVWSGPMFERSFEGLLCGTFPHGEWEAVPDGLYRSIFFWWMGLPQSPLEGKAFSRPPSTRPCQGFLFALRSALCNAWITCTCAGGLTHTGAEFLGCPGRGGSSTGGAAS